MKPVSKRAAERLATAGQGLFDPSGVFWRVNRESVLLIGGGTALLMQVAHPKIAAGVTHHSEFRERPIRRLYRTIKVMQDIIYGDRATALATAESIRQIHARVNGKLSESTSLFAVGTSYSAEDPELVLWVYATLIDTMLRTYSVFVRPLTRAEEQSFYAESRNIATLFGVSSELVPPTLDAFREYFKEMLAGPTLEITPAARSIAEDIIHPPILGMPDAFGDLASIPTLALLPGRLFERYGFRWDRKREFTWLLARRVLSGALPFAPDLVRINAGARRAEQRAW